MYSYVYNGTTYYTNRYNNCKKDIGLRIMQSNIIVSKKIPIKSNKLPVYLNKDILGIIFKYLDVNSIYNMSILSKKYNEIIAWYILSISQKIEKQPYGTVNNSIHIIYSYMNTIKTTISPYIHGSIANGVSSLTINTDCFSCLNIPYTVRNLYLYSESGFSSLVYIHNTIKVIILKEIPNSVIINISGGSKIDRFEIIRSQCRVNGVMYTKSKIKELISEPYSLIGTFFTGKCLSFVKVYTPLINKCELYLPYPKDFTFRIRYLILIDTLVKIPYRCTIYMRHYTIYTNIIDYHPPIDRKQRHVFVTCNNEFEGIRVDYNTNHNKVLSSNYKFGEIYNKLRYKHN